MPGPFHHHFTVAEEKLDFNRHADTSIETQYRQDVRRCDDSAPMSTDGHLPGVIIYSIRRISCSFSNFSKPKARWSHHSNSIDVQMSLNQGVNLSAGSSNMACSCAFVTYLVSRTSFAFASRSTSAWMKRM